MKKITILFSFFYFVSGAFSQTSPCFNFQITGSYPDTLNPNNYQISINFNSDPNDIVNYPYVSAVLDCNGDTVATGGLFYFGQLGQTTQDYPVTIIDTTTWCEPLSAVFTGGFGPLSEVDTCILSFQSAALEDVSEEQHISIYPNPVSDFLHVSVSNDLIGKSYQIVNQFGQVIIKGQIQSLHEKIGIELISNGFYMMNFSHGLRKSYAIIKD